MKRLLTFLFCAASLLAQSPATVTSSTLVENVVAAINAKMAYVGAYSAGTTYAINAVVSDSGIWYVSLQNSNTGNTPASSGSYWVAVPGSGGGSSAYRKEFVAAKCQAAAGALTFNTASTGAPTPDCYIGSNNIFGVASFSESATNTIYESFLLPSSVSAVSITFEHLVNSTTTSQDTVWQVQTGFAAHNETGDVTWNTAQTVTAPNLGTAYLKINSTISALTLTGGAAGERMYLKIFRDPAHASDDSAVPALMKAFTVEVTP